MGPRASGDIAPNWQVRSLTVLVADVVGYSRLMEGDEAHTHARMRSLRVEVIDPCIVSHRGEVVKNMGDGFIAKFESPIDAANCSADLQNSTDSHEIGEAPDQRITFRVGLHCQDIIIDGSDIFGSGVNIAARLQQQAPAGGILISATVRDALSGTGGLVIEDAGELHLKNMVRPVHAFTMTQTGRKPPPVPWPAACAADGRRARLPTLAILPLRNLSPDTANAYFAEGVIEDLIVALSHLHEFVVISRGSVLGFAEDVTIEDVGSRLGVRYVLGGSIRTGNGRLRFTFELTDGRTGSVIWADHLECDLSELFDLHGHVIEQVVGLIAGHLRRAEIERIKRKLPQDMNAYDLVLQALGFLYRFEFPLFSRARGLLDAAIELDPDYASAYVYAAKWHIFNVGQGWSTDPQADGREALRLTRLALERDPTDGLAHALHGHAHGMLFRDYDAAVESLDLALNRSPGNSWAWVLSSASYGFIGQSQSAVARAERAIRLSPIDQHAFYYFCLLAQNHYLAGSYEDASLWARRALRQNDRFNNAIRIAAASAAALGRLDEAKAASSQLMQVQPRFRVSAYARNCPFRDPSAVETYLAHLRLAGMPE